MNGPKKQLANAFRLSGLCLKADASELLVERSAAVAESERTDWLRRVVEAVQKQPLTCAVIDVSCAQTALDDVDGDENSHLTAVFDVIDVFKVPKFVYVADRKKLIERSQLDDTPLRLHGSAASKANLYRERYSLVFQRVQRHPLFAPDVVCESDGAKKFKLVTVEFLLGGAAMDLTDAVVLGMVTQLKENTLHLEDATGAIELDLDDCVFHTGLFTENSVVLVEGTLRGRVLRATAVGFPPIESAASTRQCFGDANFFGGAAAVCAQRLPRLLQAERARPDATIVLLSEVWLDERPVRDALRRLFDGFNDCPPVAFVFAGNFCSKPFGAQQCPAVKEGFKQLAAICADFPQLCAASQFVFVPGNQDPLLSNILPRPPLPAAVTEPLSARLPNCYFATNPCRLQYCSQEIVVFREDLIEKMCRNCIRPPSLQKNIATHFVKTIQSQAHLTPLPLHVSPVYWDFDHCLSLYPLPDLLVVCDAYENYNQTLTECTVTNPSSFSQNGFAFQVYVPASRQIEDSAITD